MWIAQGWNSVSTSKKVSVSLREGPEGVPLSFQYQNMYVYEQTIDSTT